MNQQVNMSTSIYILYGTMYSVQYRTYCPYMYANYAYETTSTSTELYE